VTRCLSSRELAAFVAGTAAREQIDHATHCASCSDRATIVRDIVTSHRGDSGLAYRRIRRLGANLRREAATAVDALMAEPRHRWPFIARSDDSLASTCALDEMLTRAITIMYSDPYRARFLAAAAEEVVRRLASEAAVDPRLVCRTFRDVAAVEKYCGLLDSAMSAVDRARAAADSCVDPEYERAVVDLLPARWACDPDLVTAVDGLALIDNCERVFRARGDERLTTIAMFTRAALLLRNDDPAKAAELYDAIIRAAEARGATMELASARDPLAACLVRLGRPLEAIPHAEHAVALFEALGQTIPAALARRTLATVYEAAGRTEDALEAISDAAAALARAGKIDAHIRAELVRVRILLRVGRHAEVLPLCRGIAAMSVDLDRNEPTRRRSATAEALAYLRDTAVGDVITTSVVDEVEEFLAHVDRGVVHRFVPRVPPVVM
jgi:tetratricopeptide (TPR) repeat protein